MRIWKFLLAAGIIGVVFLACTLSPRNSAARQAQRELPNPAHENPKLQDAEQRLGPFSIRGQNFTIVLHEKRFPTAADPTLAQTLESIEIRDEKNALLYQKTFRFGIEPDRLERSVTASAQLLSGKYFTGLLITYHLKLATGEQADAWQIFGYQDGRYQPQDARFRVFDKPLRTDYPMGNSLTGMKVVTPNGVAAKPMAPEAETFALRVWTGNFYVMLPVAVNFARGKLAPSVRCFGTGGAKPGVHEIGCDMPFEAERKPPDAEMTFLRLFRGPEPGEGQVLHLVLNRNSKVQIRDANVLIDWGVPRDDLMQVAFRDLWLKVRIDDDDQKEGWIQGRANFSAIGLPSRSPGP